MRRGSLFIDSHALLIMYVAAERAEFGSQWDII